MNRFTSSASDDELFSLSFLPFFLFSLRFWRIKWLNIFFFFEIEFIKIFLYISYVNSNKCGKKLLQVYYIRFGPILEISTKVKEFLFVRYNRFVICKRIKMIKYGKENCGTLRFIIFEVRDGCQRSNTRNGRIFRDRITMQPSK